MLPKNLGVVFGPTLLRGLESGAMSAVVDIPTCAQVVYSLIEHFNEVTSGIQAQGAAASTAEAGGEPAGELAHGPSHGAQSPLNNSDYGFGFGGATEAGSGAGGADSSADLDLDLDGDLDGDLDASGLGGFGQSMVGANWFVGRRSKAVCQEAVVKAKHGDYLVRQSKNGLKYFVMVNDGGSAASYTISATDQGGFVFADQTFLRLSDVVATLQQTKLQGKNGQRFQLASPVDLAPAVESEDEAGGRRSGGHYSASQLAQMLPESGEATSFADAGDAQLQAMPASAVSTPRSNRNSAYGFSEDEGNTIPREPDQASAPGSELSRRGSVYDGFAAMDFGNDIEELDL